MTLTVISARLRREELVGGEINAAEDVYKRQTGVKRDADRQSDGKKGSFTSQYCRNVLQKKVGVFEYAEQKKIQHNGGNDDGAGLFAFAPITKALYKPCLLYTSRCV